jgi:hypothetical protein
MWSWRNFGKPEINLEIWLLGDPIKVETLNEEEIVSWCVLYTLNFQPDRYAKICFKEAPQGLMMKEKQCLTGKSTHNVSRLASWFLSVVYQLQRKWRKIWWPV